MMRGTARTRRTATLKMDNWWVQEWNTKLIDQMAIGHEDSACVTVQSWWLPASPAHMVTRGVIQVF